VEATGIEVRVGTPDDLRALWLDGFADGGIFVPGAISLSAGMPVFVHLVVEGAPTGSVMLTGTVAWRRHPVRESTPPSVVLRAGVGIAFDRDTRERALFLDRLARGTSRELRGGIRYPAALHGELVLLDGERAIDTRIEDVGPRGARIAVKAAADLSPGSPIRLWVAHAHSGENAFVPLAARVIWNDADHPKVAGVQLDLTTKEERLIWARIVTRARDALESRLVPQERVTGAG
jgi:Tfp pilus assembly protein PilZ